MAAPPSPLDRRGAHDAGPRVTVAAGNAGQERGETDDDLGWIMGRIHSSGAVPAAGLEQDSNGSSSATASWTSPRTSWRSGSAPRTASPCPIKPPGMDWIGPIEPREFIQNRMLADGTMLSVYNEVYPPRQRAQLHQPLLEPVLRRDAGRSASPAGHVAGPAARARDPRRPLPRLDRTRRSAAARPRRRARGVGVPVVLHRDVAGRRHHGQLARVRQPGHHRRQPRRRCGTGSTSRAARGPPATAAQKPDVAAPGTDIVAAKGFADEADAVARR